VPEIGPQWTPKLDDDMRPIVIFTSNSERQLPDAFLRRCLYYHIEFPQSRLLHERQNGRPSAPGPGYYIEDIVWERLGIGDAAVDAGGARKDPPLVRDAISFLEHLRGLKVPLEKPPATAELLNWISAMRRAGGDNAAGLAEQKEVARRTLTALLKKGSDQERGRGRRSDQGSEQGEFDRWLAEKAR
jgi:MoxR-like ATPase